MELNETQKRYLAYAVVAIAILFVLWLLGLFNGRKPRSVIETSAVNLAPEAVRAGGTNEGAALPAYITVNAPYSGGVSVQSQPAAPSNTGCASQCGCNGEASGLLATQGGLMNTLDWDAFYQQLNSMPVIGGIDYQATTDNILSQLNAWVGYGYDESFVTGIEGLIATSAPLSQIQDVLGNWSLTTTSKQNAPAVTAILAAADNPYLIGVQT